MAFANLPLVNGPFCEGCVQRGFGERYVESDGLGTSGIMIVGEAPHTDELREGKPFVGASGAFLDRCLRRLGMERSQLFITNSVFCKVRRLGWFDKPDADAVAAFEHCRPHLDRLIERVKPKVIVTLGTTALKRVLGVGGLQERHGYVCDSPYGIPVVPSFHPSFIMQGQQKFTSVLMFALRRAQEVAVKGHSPMPVCYGLDDYAFMADYLDRGGFPLIAADIETPKSSRLDEEALEEEDDSVTIIRASLSHTPGTAVSFPWIEPFIGLFKRAVAKAETVIFHNQGFDVPRLRAAGVGFKGAIHDSMWAWHFLQSDLPKGLGFVAPFYVDFSPWKHLSEGQPAFYSATDADATLRCYMGIRDELIKQGRWERWLRHCVQVTPILERMGGKGILVHRGRQDALKARLEAEYGVAYARLQTEVPPEVLPVKRYKTGKQGGQPVDIPCPLCSKEVVI